MRILKIHISTNNDATRIIGIDLNFREIFGDNFEPQSLRKNYVPGRNDKLYFLPGVNIPRVKLKNLATEYNIKTVRDVEDATHIFAGKDTSSKIGEIQWDYQLDRIAVENFITLAKEDIDSYDFDKLELALASYTEDYVYCSYHTRRLILGFDSNLPCKANLQFQQNLLKLQYNGSDRVTAIKSDYEKLYTYVSQCDLYSETALLAHVNGDDAVIIDYTVFEQLRTMLQSSDDDNATLALEIMANCNYSDSLLYLEMLFKDCAHRISNCSAKKHVNFKSLLSYLNKNSRHLDTSLDEIIRSLMSKNVLTQDKLDVLINRYSEELKHYGSTNFFKVKTFTMSTEVLELLNSNYSNQVTEDFVPAEIETVEEIEQVEEEETSAVVTEQEQEASDGFSWF
jgi:hypothetical protein